MGTYMEMDDLRTQIVQLQKEPKFRGVLNQNIVIKNLPMSADEELDGNVTLDSVSKLSKLDHVDIVKAERKKGRNNKPGIIIVTLNSVE